MGPAPVSPVESTLPHTRRWWTEVLIRAIRSRRVDVFTLLSPVDRPRKTRKVLYYNRLVKGTRPVHRPPGPLCPGVREE